VQVSAVMHRNSLGACKRLLTCLERHMTISTRRSVSSFWRNFWTVCFRLSLNACASVEQSPTDVCGGESSPAEADWRSQAQGQGPRGRPRQREVGHIDTSIRAIYVYTRAYKSAVLVMLRLHYFARAFGLLPNLVHVNCHFWCACHKKPHVGD
jgi:hypothetical protein